MDHQEPELRRPASIELIEDGPGQTQQARPRYVPQQRRGLALGLFIATCLSTYMVGGVSYAIGIMSILLAHEMGHYLQSVRYGVPASFPYFIPFPLSPTGTMGAVIVQGPGIADRKMLFDIAITGPLAGLVVALPLAWYGVQQAEIGQVNAQHTVFGDPLLIQWMTRLHHGTLPPGYEVSFTPLLFAAWVGIFITALNLIPIGQLDGGHILYTLVGRRAHIVARVLIFVTLLWMFVTGHYSYVAMLILLLIMGPLHPPTANDRVPLGLPRIILGWLTLSFIIIGFTPVPIVQIGEEPDRQTKQQDVSELSRSTDMTGLSLLQRAANG